MPDLFEDMSEDTRSAAILDYVKGRTSDSLRVQIDAAAQSHSDIAEEIAYYRGLAHSVQKPAEAAPFDDLGWARLSKDIDREEELSTTPNAANDNGKIWRYAAAIFAFAALSQAMFFGFQGSRQNEQATYETVSEVPTDFTLQVTFASNATENDIRTLLQQTGANITSGPSALGIYEITFANKATRAAAAKAFSAVPEVIESVYEK